MEHPTEDDRERYFFDRDFFDRDFFDRDFLDRALLDRKRVVGHRNRRSLANRDRDQSIRHKDDDSGGPNAGVIAGAVVGSVAGLALIVGGLLLAYRAGRR
ncbi:hypothetical protein ACJ41O_014563 [Fusarium nematophilum]